jgi:hypothetical protein
LSFLIEDFFVPNLPHFFWVAVLDVECKLLLEENISGELFGNFALVLLFEVDESLLSAWDELNFCDFPTLASCRKIDL